MPGKNKERLYELYIASLYSEIPQERFSDITELKLPDQAELSFIESNEAKPAAAGILLASQCGDYEVQSLILGGAENGQYEAYKISSFICFASEYDLIFSSGSSRFLLQMDNHYYLEADELKQGIIFGYLSAEELLELKKRIDAYQKKPAVAQGSTDLAAPENRFRMMEHELSLGYRSRQISAALWVPQYHLQYRRDEESVLANAAADSGLDEIFRVLGSQKDKDVYFAREFSLQRNDANDLVFITDLEYIGCKAEVLCGDIAVFRGTLPRELVLARFIPISADKAQSILKVNVRLKKE